MTGSRLARRRGRVRVQEVRLFWRVRAADHSARKVGHCQLKGTGSRSNLAESGLAREAIEPRLLDLLLKKQERRTLGIYIPKTAAEVADGAYRLFKRHGIDARINNVRRMGGGASKEQFLFDEESLRITAILDWELSHIGDFHEDLAYSFDPLFGMRTPSGQHRVGSMFTTDHRVECYQTMTGRRIDATILHWVRVLTSYKLITMNHTSSIVAARDGTNHQNALLAYLSACTAGMSDTLCKRLSEVMQ